MDEKRNNRIVERKLKEALKNDRARIQVGRISHFGLLEMSRQRLRTSVLESSTEVCPHCGGTGHMRSVSSVALQLLRALDETLMKGATHNLIVRTRADVAIYVLNHKRAHLRRLEERFRVSITITTDPTMTGQPAYAIDRGEQVLSVEQAKALAVQYDSALQRPEEEAEEETFEEEAEAEAAADSEDGGRRRRRRGRRGRGGRGREEREQSFAQETAEHAAEHAEEDEEDDAEESGNVAEAEGAQDVDERAGAEEGAARKRRRGRRGGRRNRRQRGGDEQTEGEFAADAADSPEREPRYGEGNGAGEDEHRSGGRIAAEAPEPQDEPFRTDREHAAPRRRSTIREPAPAFGSGGGEAPPAPPEAPPAPDMPAQDHAESADKPRRIGWWSRRG